MCKCDKQAHHAWLAAVFCAAPPATQSRSLAAVGTARLSALYPTHQQGAMMPQVEPSMYMSDKRAIRLHLAGTCAAGPLATRPGIGTRVRWGPWQLRAWEPTRNTAPEPHAPAATAHRMSSPFSCPYRTFSAAAAASRAATSSTFTLGAVTTWAAPAARQPPDAHACNSVPEGSGQPYTRLHPLQRRTFCAGSKDHDAQDSLKGSPACRICRRGTGGARTRAERRMRLHSTHALGILRGTSQWKAPPSRSIAS